MVRPDNTILDDIWRSLWNEEPIRAIDIQDISVVVENGQACLSGHVSKDDNYQRIVEITRSIPGVMAVHNHFVTDRDLSIQVARALGENETTRPFTLPVDCHHGWVYLGGFVPNHEIQRAAEETAAGVAAARGVIRLPDIKGKNPSQVQKAVQPRISVRVFGEDGIEGIVYQVVVNPQNRLVTHAIVRVNQSPNGLQKSCDYLMTVEAMRLADACGIFLIYRTPASDPFPVFISANYPIAPLTWQPPYPYAAGSVRWPLREKAKGELPSTTFTGKAEK